MILAFIFWFIGSRAEKLWNLKFLEEKTPKLVFEFQDFKL
jgi:hypothetical protein